MELTDFLLARIAEDEAAGQVAPTEGALIWVGDDKGRWAEPPWGKTRVLADCEAKRRIVEQWQQGLAHEEAQGRPAHLFDPVHSMLMKFTLGWLRLLALPYADHEDYREEWKP